MYDVTRFLDVHPGGRRIMLPHLGKDATASFKLHHNVMTVMGKYDKSLWIGTLQGASVYDEPDPTATLFGDMVAFGDPSWYQGWTSPYCKSFYWFIWQTRIPINNLGRGCASLWILK